MECLEDCVEWLWTSCSVHQEGLFGRLDELRLPRLENARGARVFRLTVM